MSTPLQILSEYWGHTSFKPMQEEIISSVLNGRDTVALLPTGGGKSVCFQVPALINEGICIVVSPLVALMTDQVATLKSKGVKAMAIAGGTSTDELRTLLDNALYGNYKFLYLSPERLKQEMVQQAIREMTVNLFAVDEAHCISQWGNDFRPSYKQVSVVRELQPLTPIIALTATATKEVLDDTILQLQLEEPQVFTTSFVRDNLSYEVYKEDDKLYRLQQILKNNTGAAIVYVRTRSTASEVSNQLNDLGISSTFYHGGISAEDKKSRLEDWRNGKVTTMVATNAFGMGIDHPNVRVVAHIQLPESLESYFQEAGRAGRDGGPARAVLFYNDYDTVLVKKQFVDVLPSPADLKSLYRTLSNYFQVSYGEGEFTRHDFSFSEFCQTYNLNSVLTYNALNTLDRLGVIALSKEFGRTSKVRFLVPSEEAITYFEKNKTISVVGKTILRLYSGIFETAMAVNLKLVSTKTGKSVSDCITLLKQMEQDNIVELDLQTTDASLTFIVPREDDRTINPLAPEIELLNRKKLAQVEAVLGYVSNDNLCRTRQLVQYFGEESNEDCGICSVCTSEDGVSNKKEVDTISEAILDLLKEGPLGSREISEKLTFTESKIVDVLRLLLDVKKIHRTPGNQFEVV